jgi:hypothetical protein
MFSDVFRDQALGKRLAPMAHPKRQGNAAGISVSPITSTKPRRWTMPEHVDAYIALASPWAFIACRRLPTLVRGIDCAIAVKPIRLGKVFAATGGQPLPQRHESRRAYRLVEIARWAEHLGWPMHPQPRYFPVDDTGAARSSPRAAPAPMRWRWRRSS